MKVLLLGKNSKIFNKEYYKFFGDQLFFLLRGDSSKTNNNDIYTDDLLNFDLSGFDIVINYVGTVTIKADTYFINTLFPYKLYENCIKSNVKKFIHVGSVGSYGYNYKSSDINISFNKKPLNAYEISKASAEELLMLMDDFSTNKNCKLYILYPSNVITNKSLSLFKALIKYKIILIYRNDYFLNFTTQKSISNYIKYIINGDLKNNQYFISSDLSVLDYAKKYDLNLFYLPRILFNVLDFIFPTKIELMKTTRKFSSSDDHLLKNMDKVLIEEFLNE